MKTMLTGLALLAFCIFAVGCTVKASGEMSLLKKYDRYPETITSSQSDVPIVKQQGSAGAVK